MEHLLLPLAEWAAEHPAVDGRAFPPRSSVPQFLVIVPKSCVLGSPSPDGATALDLHIVHVTSSLVVFGLAAFPSNLLHVVSEVFSGSPVQKQGQIIVVVSHDGLSVLFALQLLDGNAQLGHLVGLEPGLSRLVCQKVLSLHHQQN